METSGWRSWTALGLLAATVALLYLNYLEKDHYPGALDAPPGAVNAERPAWLPPLLAHPCTLRAICPHALELSGNRLLVTVTDRDGWYRLWNAGSETYLYDDPSQLRGALENPTASADGTWTIRGRYAPAAVADLAHRCRPAPGEFELRYRLRLGRYPAGELRLARDPSGLLVVPRELPWASFEGVDFWWELENPSDFAGARKSPCPCGGL